jgi:hypothetical protein
VDRRGLKSHFEQLESRTLLAVVHPSGALQQPAVLSGAVYGTYSIESVHHASRRLVLLTGSGMVPALGHVRVTGSVDQTAGAEPGHKVGLLTFANPKGRVTLQLNAQAQDSGASGDEEFAFVVRAGTGTYQGSTGAGTIVLNVGPSNRGPFSFALEPPPGPAPTPAPTPSPTPTPTPTATPTPTPTPTPSPTPTPTILSGIRGIALEGPITPVERPGQPDTQPLPGAIITVQPAGGGPELARQQADAMGGFQIALDPGTYLIVPLPPQPGEFLPRGMLQAVTVGPDQVIDVTVNYDTGIR